MSDESCSSASSTSKRSCAKVKPRSLLLPISSLDSDLFISKTEACWLFVSESVGLFSFLSMSNWVGVTLRLGDSLGSLLFDLDSGLDGTLDGAIDGALDGVIDGAFDGVIDGALDGALDGSLEKSFEVASKYFFSLFVVMLGVVDLLGFGFAPPLAGFS
mmetsp:Transcript_32542/g.56281  ORF Transcript_32542/g.56281 Transcript_32542/m.56281 type:complete len:159 (+) Transcript_32542:2162-2638(+)